jgi:hypothetical protein
MYADASARTSPSQSGQNGTGMFQLISVPWSQKWPSNDCMRHPQREHGCGFWREHSTAKKSLIDCRIRACFDVLTSAFP